MNSEKKITICKANKKFFKHGEEVQLFIELKNIQQMTVRIYEFNTENYYKEHKSEIPNNIKLDGLIPSEQLQLTFDDPPIKKKIKKLTFSSIKAKKHGFFVVEMIGNGIKSRAVIRKGKLMCLTSYTMAGHSI